MYVLVDLIHHPSQHGPRQLGDVHHHAGQAEDLGHGRGKLAGTSGLKNVKKNQNKYLVEKYKTGMVATEITYIGEWDLTKYRRNAQFLSKI